MPHSCQFSATGLSCMRRDSILFNQISFCLQPKEWLLVEGENGTGKSSLLRILTGLSHPSAGEVLWQKNSIYANLGQFWLNMHYLGHSLGIKDRLTVLENSQLMQIHQAQNNDGLTQMILSDLKLINHAHKMAGALSQGQKRRLSLAKLFLNPKPLWLLDEPVVALDHAMQQYFFSQLTAHLNNGGMVILSSHQPLPFKPSHVVKLG